ncbi:hypothetical protein AAFF27_05530 [Xylophilus sp. GW821-FHT01B05]
MLKIAIGFAIFAAISLFALMKAGDKIDMGGEQHSGDMHAPAAPAADSK